MTDPFRKWGLPKPLDLDEDLDPVPGRPIESVVVEECGQFEHLWPSELDEGECQRCGLSFAEYSEKEQLPMEPTEYDRLRSREAQRWAEETGR